jgi:hypothetical protein
LADDAFVTYNIVSSTEMQLVLLKIERYLCTLFSPFFFLSNAPNACSYRWMYNQQQFISNLVDRMDYDCTYQFATMNSGLIPFETVLCFFFSTVLQTTEKRVPRWAARILDNYGLLFLWPCGSYVSTVLMEQVTVMENVQYQAFSLAGACQVPFHSSSE